MSVTINIPQSMRHLAGNEKTVEVGGGTVGESLKELVGRYAEIKPLIFTREGKLHGHIDIRVNRETSFPEELAKPVADGDRLDIVNIIAGG